MHRYLVTTALLMVFGTSAYMSVFGLTAVFAAHLPVVVCMGIGMELGKLLVVIHLHRRWFSMRFGSRIFYLSVAAALVMITSCEIMGFLAQSHTVTSRDLAASQASLSALDLEAELLNRQIEVTDATLAGLPAGYVTRRIVEREKVGYGAARERLLAIARQRADLAADIVDKTAQAGPVFAVARLAGLDPARAATLFILVLVMVLEPLCIGLAVATSAAWLPAAQENDTSNHVGKTEIRKRDGIRRSFMDIVNTFDLSAKEVAGITGRKKPVVVEAWLDGSVRVPPGVLRTMRRWANDQPRMVMVKGGSR